MLRPCNTSHPDRSHLDQAHKEFCTKSGTVKYSLTRYIFLPIIDQEQLFDVTEIASLTPLNSWEAVVSQFQSPEGVPANCMFHTGLFQSHRNDGCPE